MKKWKNQYGTPTYNSWNNMRFRCYNQKATRRRILRAEQRDAAKSQEKEAA